MVVQAVDDLRTIDQILREAYSAEATRSWLMARNRLLGFDRPIDRLGHGDFAAVREAAEAFVDSGLHLSGAPSFSAWIGASASRLRPQRTGVRGTRRGTN
jgi:hypothetical protein